MKYSECYIWLSTLKCVFIIAYLSYNSCIYMYNFREDDLAVLEQRCRESGLDPAAIWWYLDLRRYVYILNIYLLINYTILILYYTMILL